MTAKAKKAEAVKAKTEGNKEFKAKNYDKAIELYTKAIELDPEKVSDILYIFGNYIIFEIYLG